MMHAGSRRARCARPTPGRHAGFTLVEVLVALAITAIALGAGLKAAGAMTDNAQRLAEVTAAHWCGDNALAALRLSRQFPGSGETEFGCNQLGRDYRGLLRSQPTPNPNFQRVDALVSNADGQVLATLSTVLGRN
jgi:general secretion pathway protein I